LRTNVIAIVSGDAYVEEGVALAEVDSSVYSIIRLLINVIAGTWAGGTERDGWAWESGLSLFTAIMAMDEL
jgi:hypothetical protein